MVSPLSMMLASLKPKKIRYFNYGSFVILIDERMKFHSNKMWTFFIFIDYNSICRTNKVNMFVCRIILVFLFEQCRRHYAIHFIIANN